MMVFIDGIIFALQKAGGISICFAELSSAISQRQIGCFFLNYGGNKLFDVSIVSESNLVAPKKKCLPLSVERYMDVEVSVPASVFHSSYYRLPKDKGINVVTTVHDFTYEHFESGLKKFVHAYQKRRAILNSNVVICISENTKKDLLRFIPEAAEKDIRVIYNGVSNDYRPLDNAEQPIRPFVIFVGARSGYKNFACLVSALKDLPDYDLACVGGGAFTSQELALLDSLIPGRYRHDSYLSNEGLNMLYNQAFCLVYPSLYEGFGIPALEAMRAGCPVIAANSSSLPEICGDAAILLDKVSPSTVADAIKSLENKILKEAYVHKGLKNSSRFSWEKNAQEIIGIYKELCGEARE